MVAPKTSGNNRECGYIILSHIRQHKMHTYQFCVETADLSRRIHLKIGKVCFFFISLEYFEIYCSSNVWQKKYSASVSPEQKNKI